MMKTLTLRKPDDWHVHFRDGSLLGEIASSSARHFARALVMPNLQPPLTSLASLMAYRQRIACALPLHTSFTPYMTFYINETVSIHDLQAAAASPFVLGAKLYPRGATTHSEHGVQSVRALYPLFEQMAALDLVLQVHGEATHGDIFDREALFIEEVLTPLVHNFPRLRIVLEHISTRAAVAFVERASPRVAATITPQHLAYHRNQLLAGGIRPHYYCLPILKREEDQKALQRAAVGGSGKFFAGTDSAPHLQHAKEAACGCAGIFSAPYAMALYAEVFENLGELEQLEAFTSQYGADFYQLPLNKQELTLVKQSQIVPEALAFSFGTIIPIAAGSPLAWTIL